MSVQDNRVGPLYQHVFPPAAAPTLAFVGLPWKVVPFPQFELQGRWIARVLSSAARLPSRREMEAHCAAFYASLAAEGVPPRYTHRMSGEQSCAAHAGAVARLSAPAERCMRASPCPRRRHSMAVQFVAGGAVRRCDAGGGHLAGGHVSGLL